MESKNFTLMIRDNQWTIKIRGGEKQLPNVQNSDDFIKEMAKNKKFEKMVCAMTVDRLNGGSSLAKYKYRS